MLNAIPEPFIGNPNTAKVVLLNINPSYDDTVPETHGRPDIKEAIFRNLRHEHQDYPFYAFNPTFQGTGVSNYWREYTQELQGQVGLDDRQFAKRLLAIEWFPYAARHCTLYKRLRRSKECFCESQNYSFQLAKLMLTKQGVQVVGTHGMSRWKEVDSELFDRVPFLNTS
ncbi:hypothetical protein [Alloacidobacterium sp.]|uniref:hypothetical protein n=1 Tax=Alloacidobacterium sp. TaxID=2951999 RepID=UPI002D5C790D|nr:hypothetical protein [Alloacidobacterium sp.]HYK34427.1 hypothetical protein [Alloacidobacterium sp.]